MNGSRRPYGPAGRGGQRLAPACELFGRGARLVTPAADHWVGFARRDPSAKIAPPAGPEAEGQPAWDAPNASSAIFVHRRAGFGLSPLPPPGAARGRWRASRFADRETDEGWSGRPSPIVCFASIPYVLSHPTGLGRFKGREAAEPRFPCRASVCDSNACFARATLLKISAAVFVQT